MVVPLRGRLSDAFQRGRLNMNDRPFRDQTWESDPDLVKALAVRFTPHGRFDLDPCASMLSAKAGYYYTEVEDGLDKPWTRNGVLKYARRQPDAHPLPNKLSVYVNFPFGSAEVWIARLFHWIDTYPNEFHVIAVVCPSRTDRPWYHRLRRRGYLPDIEGRVSYGDLAGSPNFSSTAALVWPPFRY